MKTFNTSGVLAIAKSVRDNQIMKAYLTKHALTKGILTVEGKFSETNEGVFIIESSPDSCLQFEEIGAYIFLTEEEAIEAAEKQRKAKIASLKKQLEKLQANVFKGDFTTSLRNSILKHGVNPLTDENLSLIPIIGSPVMPTLAADEYIHLTLTNKAKTKVEIVKCYDYTDLGEGSGYDLHVERGLDGTTSQNWDVSDCYISATIHYF